MASQQQIQMLADRYISQIKANPLAGKVFVDGVELSSQSREVRDLVTNFTNSLEYDRLVTEFQQKNEGPGESATVQTLAGRYGIPEGLRQSDLLHAVADIDMPWADRVAIFQERGFGGMLPEQEPLDSAYKVPSQLKSFDAWFWALGAGATEQEAQEIFRLRGGVSSTGPTETGDQDPPGSQGSGQWGDPISGNQDDEEDQDADSDEIGVLTDEQLAAMVMSDIRETPSQFRGSGLLSYRTASGEALGALPQGVQDTVNAFLESSDFYDILAEKNPELFRTEDPSADVDNVLDDDGNFAATGAGAYGGSLANEGDQGNRKDQDPPGSQGTGQWVNPLSDNQADRLDQDPPGSEGTGQWVDPVDPTFAATGADAYSTASTGVDEDDEFTTESGTRFRTRPGGLIEQWDPVTGEWTLFGDTGMSNEDIEGGEGVKGISDFMGDTPAAAPGGYEAPSADEIDTALALGEMPDEEAGGPWGGESVWTSDRVNELIEHYGAKSKQDFGDQVAEMDQFYNARGLSWSGARQDALGRAVEDFSEHYTENIVNPIMLKAMESIEQSEQTRWKTEFDARVTEAELTGQYQRRPFDLNELAGIDNASFLTEDGKLDREVYEANVGGIIEQYKAVVGRNPTNAELTKLIRGGEVSPFGPTLGQQDFELREAATTGYYKNAPVLEFLLQNDAQDHEAMLMAGFTFTDPTTGESKRVLGIDERADKEFLRESDILNGYWAPTVRYDAEGNREVVYETVTTPTGDTHRMPVMNRIWGTAELAGFVENERLRLTQEGMDDEDARYYADLEWQKMQRNGYSTTITDPTGQPRTIWVEGEVSLERGKMNLQRELLDLQLDHETAERLATEDYNEKVRRGYWMTDGYGHPIYIHGAQDHDLRIQRIQNEFDLSRDEAEREWRRQERVGYSEVEMHPGSDGILGTDDDVYLGTRHVQGTQGWDTWEANRKDQLVRDGWDEESAEGVARWERDEKTRGGYWMADDNVPGGKRWVRGTEAHEARIEKMRDTLVRDGWTQDTALQAARHVHEATMEQDRLVHEKWVKTRTEWFRVQYLLPHDEAMAQAEREWRSGEEVLNREHDKWSEAYLRKHQKIMAMGEQNWRAAEAELDRIHDTWLTTRVEWFKVNYGYAHDRAMAAAEQEWRSGEAKLDRESQEKMNTEDLQEARAIRDAELKSDMLVASIAAIAKIASNSVLGDGESLIEKAINLVFGDDNNGDGDDGDGGWLDAGTLLTAAGLKKLLDPNDKSGLGEEFWQSMADEMNILRNGETETTTTDQSEDQAENGPTEETKDGKNEEGSDRAEEFDQSDRGDKDPDESGEAGVDESDSDGVTDEPIEIEWDRINFKQMATGFVVAAGQEAYSREVDYEYWAAQNPYLAQGAEYLSLGAAVANGYANDGKEGAVSAFVGWVGGKVVMSFFGEGRADTHAQMDVGYDQARTLMSDEMLKKVNDLANVYKHGRWSFEINMATGDIQWRPYEAGMVGQSLKDFTETAAEFSARTGLIAVTTQADVLERAIDQGDKYQRLFFEKWQTELLSRDMLHEDHKWAFVRPEDGHVMVFDKSGRKSAEWNLSDEIEWEFEGPVTPEEHTTGNEGLGEEDEDTMHSDQSTERTS